MKTSRSPDYDLTFLNKTTNAKGRIGAAWVNDDGSISIVLNPFVTLPSDPSIAFRLFKRTSFSPQQQEFRSQAGLDEPSSPPFQQ